MIQNIKKVFENTPYFVGHHLAKIPFKYRLGSQYTEFARLVDDDTADERYVVEQFAKIFNYAREKFKFYQELYAQHGALDLQIESLADIERVPIITKEMLRGRIEEFGGHMKLNTGGTAGTPFALYVDKHAFAREWAHMHRIWGLRGYQYRDFKLTLRGKNLGSKCIIYNPVHNEFVLNTYRGASDYIHELVRLVGKRSIHFLHGYPSAIYNFLKEVEACASAEQIGVLKANLRTCLLASEFPLPYMTQYLTEEWGLNYISWYGHSEMCVLAYDPYCSNEYVPFHSYGFTEVVGHRLIGTSYHNRDMPLIRYDTGDLVRPKKDSRGLLLSFKVKEGRNGDFVEDKVGKQVPLTGLIFGRHHRIFEYIDCIQVRQLSPGKVKLLLTSKTPMSTEKALEMIDTANVNLDISVEFIDHPILTAAGKMPLKVA